MSTNCELQNPPSDICNSHSSPTILVTGGAGYIGSHTVKLLLQHGYQPNVMGTQHFFKPGRIVQRTFNKVTTEHGLSVTIA